VITGLHDRSEVLLDDLCRQLGGFDCRIFDPYFFYSECADRGWLRRVEYIDQRGQVGVHFYYPEGGDIEEIRQRLIKSILQMAAQEPKLWRHGRAVIWEDDRPRLVVRNPEYVKKGEKNLLTNKGVDRF
ncbi:MAG: hypothetical protein ACOY81_11275, partial [Bacillota bacterium]